MEPAEVYLRRLLGRLIPLPGSGQEVSRPEAARVCAAWIRLAAAALNDTTLTGELQELLKQADQETYGELVAFLKEGGQPALHEFVTAVIVCLFQLWLGPVHIPDQATTNVGRALWSLVAYHGHDQQAATTLTHFVGGNDRSAWEPLWLLVPDGLLQTEDVDRAIKAYFG